MPLKPEERAFLRTIHKRLTDEPLQEGSELYEPIYEKFGTADPVSLMLTHIEFSEIESIQMFSGFRGSGKTTELLRLQKLLEDQGYFVLYADALEYVNPAEPIGITDLLIAMAGAFSDALEPKVGVGITKASFWARLTNFLTTTEVKVKEAGIKVDAASPATDIIGGLKAGVDLKLQFKTAPMFRQSLQEFLANRIGELKNQVDLFFEDGVKAIRELHGPDARVVFIFDQLEQIRGTLQNEQDVLRSVERLFAIHIAMLKIPYVHAVYTVPPWLKFLLPPLVRITILPTIHLWNNDDVRSRHELGWTAFRSLVKRRLGDEGLDRLFGARQASHPLVDRIIDVCGGHFRDLLRLLRETLLRASALTSLPVPEAVVETVINAARSDFLPIAIDDAKWLNAIARARSTALPSIEAGPVNRLTRFLDNHFVLYFTNAKDWYDIHPLIRDEVVQVMGSQIAEMPA
jgi:hypothetical protein